MTRLPGSRRSSDDPNHLDHADHAAHDDRPSSLPRRPPFRIVVLLVIGAVFGAVATLTWTIEPSARSVEAVVGAIDPSGSALALSEPAEMSDRGFGLVGVLWREGDGEWQQTLSEDGFPTCLQPGDEGRPVLLGLVTDPGGVGRPPAEVITWVQCPPR